MKKRLVLAAAACLACLLIAGGLTYRHLMSAFSDTISNKVIDRNGESILIQPNNKGYLVIGVSSVSPEIKALLLKKEDRYFPYHPGINLVSIFETLLAKAGIGSRGGSSTLTQQLAKLILGNETKRTLTNKIIETTSAIALEAFESKETILNQYADSIYFGNQIQGIETASRAYFGLPSDKLSTEQVLQLLVAIDNPSYSNPLLSRNIDRAVTLAKQLDVTIDETAFEKPEVIKKNLDVFVDEERAFELGPWLTDSIKSQKTVSVTLDISLNDKIRNIVASIMPGLYARDAHNAAVVVIDVHTGEILAAVGSPHPSSNEYGQQIDMLTKSRQIASTMKPFVYAKAFEAGMRPYTQIDDREYAYTTADGRILYPRNFDGKYHGIVNADYALANSINVPAIKTLEFVGQDTFREFLAKLGYPHPEKVVEHQLGTALGTIDMTLIELTHYYSLFPNRGNVLPLHIFKDDKLNAQFYPTDRTHVIDAKYTELITKTLADRYLAIDQFGYGSALSLPIDSYALKTGTSDDYRDTWVIGYTPDFIVGAWAGNADNSPTKNLSGQTGAGEIWSRVMELLMDTPYNHNTAFSFDLIQKVSANGKDSYGLPGDDVSSVSRLLLDAEDPR